MAKDIQATAKASVLPAGSVPPVATLDPGKVKVEIATVSEEVEGRRYVTCVYPDGFTREHHVVDAADLATKITNQLLGRFGATAKSLKTPALEEGAVFTVEV